MAAIKMLDLKRTDVVGTTGNVRRVRPDEVPTLREISISTFVDTYAEHNTAENMASYIEKAFHDDRLLGELNSENSRYYFAEFEEDILGYLRLNFGTAQTNQSLENACEIERIYVAKNFQGLKIGRTLYEKAIKSAQNAGSEWLWLSVWDQNEKAIGFYENLGFTVFGRNDFKLGTEEQSDLLMRLPITVR